MIGWSLGHVIQSVPDSVPGQRESWAGWGSELTQSYTDSLEGKVKRTRKSRVTLSIIIQLCSVLNPVKFTHYNILVSEWQTSLLHYRLLHHIKSYRREVWSIPLTLTLFNRQRFVLNKGRLGKETHICSAGVKHVSDSFAHFEQQQTCSLRFIGVLLQIWEHMTQQGINIWNLCDTMRQHFITEAQERKAHPPVWHLLTCE